LGAPLLPPGDIGAGTLSRALASVPPRPASAHLCGFGGKARSKAGDHGVQGRSPAFRVGTARGGTFGRPRRHLTSGQGTGRCGDAAFETGGRFGSAETRPPAPCPRPPGRATSAVHSADPERENRSENLPRYIFGRTKRSRAHRELRRAWFVPRGCQRRETVPKGPPAARVLRRTADICRQRGERSAVLFALHAWSSLGRRLAR
jgi:hypothetical protein